MKICKTCGNKLSDDDKECLICKASTENAVIVDDNDTAKVEETIEGIRTTAQNQPEKKKGKGIWIAVAVVVLLGIIGVISGGGDKENSGDRQASTSTVQPDSSEQSTSDISEDKVTYDNFLKINMGSSYSDVVAILGEEGTEESSNDIAGIKTVMYSWKGPGLSSLNIIIQDDEITTKAQMGLQESAEEITLDQYNQVREGMTYAQAKAILGEGQILSQSEIMGIDTTMYAWINKDGANANLTFQGDSLQVKAQFNLK
ncbi:DUF3862 domain-containing protein [Clostridium aminobutyricum]|uniref:DUF3862 domain-containing protein n=1 Tax=Clostridium aminobutyricum TaxID=33953 RepID=A0A939DBG7_CLOAM|nr:DUF3862 domain-containing protein [Clostridium aminobutyricum]MBN7774198.1 DUF3862 domain-containing protein [Clostridium aminobutyricum]